MSYKCSCGFEAEKMGPFVAHFRYNKGNGDHKSLGRTNEPEPAEPEDPAEPEKPKAPKASPKETTSSSAKSTTALAEAQIVGISPRRFEMTSTLLWQAREAAIRELGWPELSPEDFLDTWLFLSFKNLKGRSIILGAYQVVSKEDGNGS